MNDLIRADFDRLALLENEGWNHNNHFHSFLLKQLPAKCDQALDIGCGVGTFSRLLAGRSRRVLGLDLSAGMIGVARQRSRAYSNLEFQIGDVLAWDFPYEQFDCIASIATLHHMPLDSVLQKMKAGLKPGGVLLILDLYKSESMSDRLTDLFSICLGMILVPVMTGRLRTPEAVRKAWDEHGKHDAYLPMSAIRLVCADILPGARVRRHLLWRYSIIWIK